MKLLFKFFFATLLLTAVPAKGSDYPFGGTCDPISREKVKSIASTALKGVEIHFNKGQQACAHNIQVVSEGVDKYLRISLRRGDGIGNNRQSETDSAKTVLYGGSSDWSDIETGRRRFEIEAVNGRRFTVGKTLVVSYDFRVDPEHEFIDGHPYPIAMGQVLQAKEYQKDGKQYASYHPLFIFELSPSGYNIFGVPIQKAADFRNWVNVKFELPTAVSLLPRVKVWVDGELRYEGKTLFHLNTRGQGGYLKDTKISFKFGLYQHHLSPKHLESPAVQSINIRNFKQEAIDKDIPDAWFAPTEPTAFCYNKATNRATRTVLGQCDVGYEGINLEE